MTFLLPPGIKGLSLKNISYPLDIDYFLLYSKITLMFIEAFISSTCLVLFKVLFNSLYIWLWTSEKWFPHKRFMIIYDRIYNWIVLNMKIVDYCESNKQMDQVCVSRISVKPCNFQGRTAGSQGSLDKGRLKCRWRSVR